MRNNILEIVENNVCCGCEVCAEICPVHCISMVENELGFRYPSVDTTKCISCGLCKKRCCVDNYRLSDNDAIGVYAAYNKNRKITLDSSSGGIFWLLAEQTIACGGTVYGAKCVPPYTIEHDRAETIEECEKFRKSKYLPSRIGNCYSMVREDLNNGRKVLFSGTPCQVAGLYSYLGTKYNRDLLLTVGVICHGVPSPVLYQKYIVYLEKKNASKVVSTCWRDKRNGMGWAPNHTSFNFSNGKELSCTSYDNEFQAGFLYNFYLRESCYTCKFAKLPRVEDISLGDFWGYEGQLTEGNRNAGISAVVISSENGQRIWHEIADKVAYHTVDMEYMKGLCRHLWIHPQDNPQRHKLLASAANQKWSQIRRGLHVGWGYKTAQKLYRQIWCYIKRIRKHE